MGRRGQGRAKRALAAAVALMGVVPFAAAQVADGGRTLQLTLGQTLEYSDNIDLVAEPEDNTLRSSTRLGLSYRDITRTQRLEFSAAGTLELDSSEDTDDSDVADPFARFVYALEGRNTRFRFAADYRRTDLEDTFLPLSFLAPGVTLPDELVDEVARIEGGLRTDRSYRLGFETGLQSLVGFRLDLSSQERRYNEVELFELDDTDQRRAEVETTFRIDPTVTARVFANTRRFRADNEEQSRRDDTSYGVGATFDITPARRLDIELGRQEIERERDGPLREVSGGFYRADLSQALRNGEITLNFSSQPTLNGRDTVLRTTRDMTLPRGSTFSYGIGLSDLGDFDTEALFSLAYVKPLKRGRFGIELNQRSDANENTDDAVILTNLTASYALALSPNLNFSLRAGLNDVDARSATGEDRRGVNLRSDLVGQINAISSWSIGATLSDTEVVDQAGTENLRRYGVQMTYRRELTRDWDLVARYQHSSVRETDELDRESNTISLGIERTFDYKF